MTIEKMRHSCAHLLAAAVVKLWPNTKIGIGPTIKDGFYYDFEFAGRKPAPGESDLPKIEKTMAKLKKEWNEFKRQEVSIEKAKEIMAGQPYKLELIDELAHDSDTVSFYKSGSFIDLCKGEHVKQAKDIGPFKLLSIAGAYWKGNEKNKMLTRIYGTCFPTQKELDEYILMRRQAKERDHRKIGRELELFTLSKKVGPGLVLWLPNGTIIKDELEKYAKEVEAEYGYQRVSTPHISKEGLYITSGHLPYYAQDMYPPMEYEGEKYYVKPMNCPHMHMIYKFKPRSYKELPIRFAEFGTVYRHEDSGTLMGLMRVRGHTTNDAHIYCAEEQVISELASVLKMHEHYYKLLGIKEYRIELALPDFEKKKDKYFNDPAAWEKAVALLREAAKASKLEVIEKKGGAAFYGPKFDFDIKSAIGREFGASTNQLDFGSGKRFNLTYIDKKGKEKIIPYIIHRAPLGSHERFIGFLIEHFAGAFPVWLHPAQVKILPVSDKFVKYARKISSKLKAQSSKLRIEVDGSDETLGSKIRKTQKEKVPYMLIVGAKEEKNKTVNLRLRTGKEIGEITAEKFIEVVGSIISAKSLKLWD